MCAVGTRYSVHKVIRAGKGERLGQSLAQKARQSLSCSGEGSVIYDVQAYCILWTFEIQRGNGLQAGCDGGMRLPMIVALLS